MCVLLTLCCNLSICIYAQSQLQRSKDQLERLNEQREFEVSKESEGQETAKRLQKQLRDLQEKYNELEKKEAETVHSKASLVCVMIKHLAEKEKKLLLI